MPSKAPACDEVSFIYKYLKAKFSRKSELYKPIQCELVIGRAKLKPSKATACE